MPSPLDGIRALDLTQYQNGPWATVMLADMGAEVIKVEDPATGGEPGRTVHGLFNVDNRIDTYLETMNRNKKSCTLHLKSKEGQEVFYRLAKKADVVVHNWRIGVAEKLGVGYEQIRKVNPRIVYASASGYGSQGPDAHDGVYYILGQARGGFMWSNSINESNSASSAPPPFRLMSAVRTCSQSSGRLTPTWLPSQSR